MAGILKAIAKGVAWQIAWIKTAWIRLRSRSSSITSISTYLSFGVSINKWTKIEWMLPFWILYNKSALSKNSILANLNKEWAKAAGCPSPTSSADSLKMIQRLKENPQVCTRWRQEIQMNLRVRGLTLSTNGS